MKRWIVQTLTLTVSFLIVPQLIHAEGTGEAESKTLNSIGTLINEQTEILENNLNETAEVVEVLAESTDASQWRDSSRRSEVSYNL